MSKCEHIELSTDDPNQARDFYSKLFGWQIDSMAAGGGDDHLIFRTENGGGGITAKMSPQQPTAWMPYFTVASVKTALASATKLGGAITMPYTPIGEMGAIAVVSDPTGAHFGLWEMTQAATPPAKATKTAATKTAAATPAKATKPAAKNVKPAAKPAKGAAPKGKKPSRR